MTSPEHHESTEGLRAMVGARVWTKDGKELGTVKEVQGDAFKIDAPMKKDYWLSITQVLQSKGGALELDFDEEVLDDYKLSGPDSPSSESPMLDAQADTFSSEADKEIHREAQEHPGTRG